MQHSRIFVILVGTIGLIWASPASRTEIGLRLIQSSPSLSAQWMTRAEVQNLQRNGIHFMDITDHPSPAKTRIGGSSTFARLVPKFQDIIEGAFAYLSIPRSQEFIAQFSAYHNRSYDSPSGAASSDWLLSQVVGTLANSSYTGNVSVNPFTHAWPQNSIIARIDGSDPELKREVVILGAHLDSTNGFGTRAPGADDDGSGAIVVLEAFRILLQVNYAPKRTVEFHWYAAEEVGLLGSQDIALSYSEAGVQVASMVQFDVVGWSDGQSKVAFATVNTDNGLTDNLRLIVDKYLNYGWENRVCANGCTSDHYSWMKYGYPAAFPIESQQNPHMHRETDTIEFINFEQILEFTKLGIAYAVSVADAEAKL